MPQPDVIHGYRRWRVDKEGRLYALRGLSMLTWTAWPDSLARVATCFRGFFPWGEHRAPVKDCTCGIYAWRDPAKVLEVSEAPVDSYGPSVVGVVQLWGRVMQHGLGFRAEWARPVAVAWSEHAPAVAARYGIITLGSLDEWRSS